MPSAASELRSVRIRVRCVDERDFQERFAPWYAADGIFLPGELPAPLGTGLRVTIELQDGRRVLSGTARVDARVEVPLGTRLRILRVDPGSVPLAPVLTPVGSPPSRTPPSAQTQPGLREVLFADLPPPEEYAASRPLQVRSSPIKLRLRPTGQSEGPGGD
jgi:hypothetical protein